MEEKKAREQVWYEKKLVDINLRMQRVHSDFWDKFYRNIMEDFSTRPDKEGIKCQLAEIDKILTKLEKIVNAD